MLHPRMGNIVRGLTALITPSELHQLRGTIVNHHAANRREYDQIALNDYIHKRLILLLDHTSKTVPFYQKIWRDVGVTESALRSQKITLQDLPLVDKIQLSKQSHKQLLSTVSRPAKLSKSSGTTGRSAFRFMDLDAHIFNHLAVRRYLQDNHISIGSTILFAHSDKTTPILSYSVPPQHFTKRIYVSVFTLIENPKLVQGLNIDVVVGSPHQLQLLARSVFSKDSVKPPRLFVSIAERLDEDCRRIIQESTGGTLIDVYCASEFSALIAFECRKYHRLHTNADYVLIEVLDSDGRPVPQGNRGEVVVTDLCNFVSPLIRYRIGDIATVASNILCDCQRALPIQLDKIDGRITDQIALEGGGRISVLPLLDNLRILLGSNFTLVQEEINLFSLYSYEPNEEIPKSQISNLQECIVQYVNTNLSVKFHSGSNMLDRMRDVPGKLRPFISKVPRSESLAI